MLLVPAAQAAAPIGAVKLYKVPTANSEPRAITLASDGNMWFTEGTDLTGAPAKVGRVTPAGAVTEFPVECNSCILTDIAQGPGNILYFTSNNPELGRINTATGAVVTPTIPMPSSSALAGRLAIHGNDVWITDFNSNVVWRYQVATGQFTSFPDPGALPTDVAVDAAGVVWIAEPDGHSVGRLDPATGSTITHVATPSSPRGIAVATDGQVWYTSRFDNTVGRVTPGSNAVTEFAVPGAGPEFIAPATGSMWFTQELVGNVASIGNDGVVTQGKAVKGSGPLDIAIDPGGDPWYTMFSANKIAELQLR
jgi:virginiamycin B lyase